ncbi:hypothetical protein ElyMa_002679600 [Elysia marginata]|uniref:Uncharacterized protein n=1 Tax=Elysia marginata TaxID=1093978 RepID=A0AAV4H9G8_9GAST|nr:hypothetical protein ElyMa_002679600 [Elysia marginata]
MARNRDLVFKQCTVAELLNAESASLVAHEGSLQRFSRRCGHKKKINEKMRSSDDADLLDQPRCGRPVNTTDAKHQMTVV